MENVLTKDQKIRKAIEATIEVNDVYQMEITDQSDLIPNTRGKGSVHVINEANNYSKEIPIVFDSVEEHKKFHSFNLLRQGLVQTQRGTYTIQEKKQIVDVDMSQRPRVVQGKYGPIPHMFSIPNTPQDLSNPVYKKRW